MKGPRRKNWIVVSMVLVYKPIQFAVVARTLPVIYVYDLRSAQRQFLMVTTIRNRISCNQIRFCLFLYITDLVPGILLMKGRAITLLLLSLWRVEGRHHRKAHHFIPKLCCTSEAPKEIVETAVRRKATESRVKREYLLYTIDLFYQRFPGNNEQASKRGWIWGGE